jgi:cysteine synthase A
MAKIARDITELIGNTPLVRLNKITAGLQAEIIAKLEAYNPAFSVKDRLGYALIRDKEERGLLKAGMTIIEATSGNTGIGLAFVCAVKGYRLIIVMPENMTIERQKLLKAYGAEVVLTPDEEGMAGAVRKAEELARAIPNALLTEQFRNLANVRIHKETTAREIWNDTDGRVDSIVCGIGTGGTITGIAEALKPMKPGLTVFGVEPQASAVLSGGEAGHHKIPGIGAGFVPEILRRDLLDGVIAVTNRQAFETARRLIREEGILCGISSGAAVWAAVEVAKRAESRSKMIVVILPDGGERYLSTKLFSD